MTTLTNAIGSAAHQEADTPRTVEMLLFHYYEI